MQKSSNPTFKQSLFSDVPTTKKSAMTVSGTYIKTLLLTIIVIASAASSWWWMQDSITSSNIRWWPLWLTSLLAFFVGMVITFNPKKAPVLSIPYAIIQGAFLGVVSGTFAESFEGIVGQAVFLTLAVFLAVYVGYALGLLRATETFARIIITAILGILMFSMLSWIFSLFGFVSPVVYGYGTWGIVFSAAVVLVAALSLVLDFDFIDQAAKNKMPKYFEWYGAFGLMVGLIWLYIQILQLLAKFAASSR